MVEDTSGAYDPTVPAGGAWVGRPAPEAMSDEEKSYFANFPDLLCKEKSLLPGLVHDVGEGRLAAWESVSSDKLIAEDIVTEKQAALIEFRARRGPVSEHQRKARVAKLSRYFQNYEGKSFKFLPRRRDKSLVSPPGPEFFAESIKVLSTPEDVPMAVARHRKADEDHRNRLAQFGSRFTTLNGDFKWPGTFAFKSALAKAKMDERMAALESSDGRARRLLDKGAEVDRVDAPMEAEAPAPASTGIDYSRFTPTRRRNYSVVCWKKHPPVHSVRAPLYTAGKLGHVDAARLLLDKGAEVDRAEKDGRTPLYIACKKGHVNAAQLLLDRGAEVDRVVNGLTPLFAACERGRVDAARLLLDKGAEVDRADNYGRTLLSIVCYNGNVNTARLLLDRGARLNSDYMDIACKAGRIDVAKLLMERGVEIDHVDQDGSTMLHRACHTGDVKIAETLVKLGAAIDRGDNQGRTSLFIACERGTDEAARMLLREDAAVDQANNVGWTPLHVACKYGRVDLARLLLDSGAEVDRPDQKGHTPLYKACLEGHISAAKLLLERSADANRVRTTKMREFADFSPAIDALLPDDASDDDAPSGAMMVMAPP